MNASNESSSLHSRSMEILHITSTTVNMVLAIPGNGCILWLVLSGAAGTMASDFFTLNLSVCEILFGLCFLFLLIFRELQCGRLYYFLDGFLYTGRPTFQSCICVERFMAVVHPVKFLKYKPLRYRVACSVLAWLVITGASLLYMELGYCEISFYVHLGESLFFMSVMLFCSLAVLRALKQPVPGDETGIKKDNSMKRRAFTIICVIMVSFLGTYFLYGIAIVTFASQGQLLSDEMKLATAIYMFIAEVTGLVQPLLYLHQKIDKLPCVKTIPGTVDT